jgi:hypothetical protein
MSHSWSSDWPDTHDSRTSREPESDFRPLGCGYQYMSEIERRNISAENPKASSQSQAGNKRPQILISPLHH